MLTLSDMIADFGQAAQTTGSSANLENSYKAFCKHYESAFVISDP